MLRGLNVIQHKQINERRNGVHLLENLRLDELVGKMCRVRVHHDATNPAGGRDLPCIIIFLTL